MLAETNREQRHELRRNTYKFNPFEHRLAPGRFRGELVDGCWPVEYAERVYVSGRTGERDFDSRGVAVFGGLDEPWAQIGFGRDSGSLQALFYNEFDRLSVSYGFYGARERYGSGFDVLSPEELQDRDGFAFSSHMTVNWWSSEGLEKRVSVLMRPDGYGRRIEESPPWDGKSLMRAIMVEHDEWPGFDPEACWVPVPEFGDWDGLLVPHRAPVDVFDCELVDLRPRPTA